MRSRRPLAPALAVHTLFALFAPSALFKNLL